MGKYLTLDDAKQHLLVEFDDDDKYIEELIKAVECSLANDINRPLSEVENEDGTLPDALLHAMRIKLGKLYMAREGVSFAKNYELPFTFANLFIPYRKES